MAAGIAKVTTFTPTEVRKTVNQQLTANGDVTDWVTCYGNIAIQISGVATGVTAVVERSTQHPTLGAKIAPASDVALSGNPSTGISVVSFFEPGGAWWRVRLTSLTGASVDVGISTSGT